MNNTLLVRAIGRTYYRQNAGLFAFLFFIMVLAVGRANEVGLLEYHYSLIIGTLTNASMLLPVLIAWLLYAWKCLRFVETILQRREYSFLYQQLLTGPARSYRQLLLLQLLIYLPVGIYVLFMLKIGFQQQLYAATFIVLLFNVAVCLLSAARYYYLLGHPGARAWTIRWKMPSMPWKQFYPRFLIRYILVVRPMLLLVTKLFSCGMLYLIVANTLTDERDHRMIFLFYSFGLLGHGALLFRIKEMELSRLGFYRALPVSLGRRLLQYMFFYLLLFLPESFIILSLTPERLYWSDALLYFSFGYGILLLLNSLLLFSFERMMNYLKVIGVIYFFIFVAVLVGLVPWLSIAFLVLSITLFLSRYYQQEV
ncbi:MAG: hypothetical protein J7621_30055 [Niastella sp.]|nr:hypothetical protein [Niastella sp.]